MVGDADNERAISGQRRAGRMSPDRLHILFVSQIPPSPPRFGAQARIHGLMTQMARRHDLTAVMLVDEEFDIEECRQALQSYCREVVLIPNPYGRDGLAKRLVQLRSLTSTQSFERLRVRVPALQQAVDRVLRAKRFDVVNLEFTFLGHCDLRQAPPGERPPTLIVDSHNIDYDLARQYGRTGSLGRRLYNGINWRKLRREELGTYRDADGVCLCSATDERRLQEEGIAARTAVIPNAADVEYYQPRAENPPDGRTVVFFGLMSYVPNVDGVTHFLQEIWPSIAAKHPDARCKIIGGKPPPSLLALAGPGIEFTGFVPDLRPHLASAAAVVVPLRLGGGTRLKIVEAMAMGKAIVSTTLGAEGIEAMPGRDLLIEDEPARFGAAVNRLLAEPDLAAQIGQAARQLAVEKYSWHVAATALEGFYRRIMAGGAQRSSSDNVASTTAPGVRASVAS
jgi:glycosyltransferase involved in cell wall biosynthesis